MAHVSIFEHRSGSGPLTVGILVETEIKLPGAAKEFGAQIGGAQWRFANADRIEMLLEGDSTPITVLPDRIIFSRRTMLQRVAVTPTALPETEQYRFSFTGRGGYPESFLRVGVKVKTDVLEQLVSVLFPR